jgi:hypothetical protein
MNVKFYVLVKSHVNRVSRVTRVAHPQRGVRRSKGTDNNTGSRFIHLNVSRMLRYFWPIIKEVYQEPAALR